MRLRNFHFGCNNPARTVERMAKSPINIRLEKAVALHHAGKLGEAERLYDQILALDRRNPDALNLKGAVANTLGRHSEALDLFDRAIKGMPNVAAFHLNHGLALAALDRHEEALRAYAHAAKLKPDYIDAHLNIGIALNTLGRAAEAAATFRAVTQAAPHDPRGFHNLGISLEKSLAATREDARAAVADEARAAFTRSVQLDTKNPEAHLAFANLHSFLGEYELAIARLKITLSLDPKSTRAWNNLGSMFESLGRRGEAIGAFDQALALDPNDAGAAVNRGLAYLAMGRLTDGWDGYGRRFEDPRFPFVRRDWPWPTWRGEDLSGKKILIWSDQGIGDEVLYASLVPEVAGKAATCVLECAPRLAPLYQRSFPHLRIVANTAETRAILFAESFDYQSSVLDLGRWLRPSLAAFPNRRALLTPDAARVAELRKRYRALAQGRRVIGFSWRSVTPGMAHQKGRPLAAFAPLLASDKLTFINLQYGAVDAELAAAAQSHGIKIIVDSEIDSLKNLDNFAAQVAALDGVVSISNTTAHFAGVLGVPTFLYVPAGSKQLWYWLGEGAFSPWYRSIRISRETDSAAFREIRTVLEAW